MSWVRYSITAALLLFVVASLGRAVLEATGVQHASTVPATNLELGDSESSAPIVAFYFHTNTRCSTCRTIEANSEAALADAVQNGTVAWRVVNYEEPAYRHYAEEFQLEFASLVIAKSNGAGQSHWKNLDRVWELYDDRAALTEYVNREVSLLSGVQP